MSHRLENRCGRQMLRLLVGWNGACPSLGCSAAWRWICRQARPRDPTRSRSHIDPYANTQPKVDSSGRCSLAGAWHRRSSKRASAPLGWLLCGLVTSAASAPAPSSLLHRALNCELHESEVPSLMTDLARGRAEFRHRHARHFMPAADVYRLRAPVVVQGHSSRTVAVARMRILALVPGLTVRQASRELQLASREPDMPSMRDVSDGASVIAESIDHPGLSGQLLLGCAYHDPSSAKWVPEFRGPPVGRDQPNPLRGWMD